MLLTNNSASSKYVRTELNFAIAKDKTIIPVMFGKTILPPGIEMMLSPYQFIVVDPVKDIYYLENLVEELINALPTIVFSTNEDHIYQDETLLWESDDGSISARQQLKELYKEKKRKWWIAHALATGSLMFYVFYLNTLSGVNDQQMILYYVLCTYAILVSPFLKPIEPDDALLREILRTKYFFANLLVSFLIQGLAMMAAQYLSM